MMSANHIAITTAPDRTAVALLLTILFLSGGCRGKDPVTVHASVPVTRTVEPAAADDGQARFRMITAINEQPDGTWFFKLTGSLEQVALQESAWEQFLTGVKFARGQPEWDLPTGWEIQPERPMRFATIRAGTSADAPEISVSSLPPGQPLGANVNRWRGQLGLGPIDDVELQRQIRQVQGSDAAFQVYDARGPRLNTGMGAAPFAGGAEMPETPQPPANRPAVPPESIPAPAATQPETIDFQEPDDWTPGTTTSFVAGRWTRGSDAGTLELALMKMNPSEESWRMNVEAWAAQVGLVEKPDVAQLTRPVTVDASTARTLRLDGPVDSSGQPDGQSVIVAMFEDLQGNGWVVKLSGSAAAVDQYRATFDTFLGSIRFR